MYVITIQTFRKRLLLFSGLQSETEYKFKVLAVNPRGYSPYSEEVTIKTKRKYFILLSSLFFILLSI